MNGEIVAEEIPQAQQQIDLIHRAMARLHLLVHRDHHRRGRDEAAPHPARERAKEVPEQGALADWLLPVVPEKRLVCVPAAIVVREVRLLAIRTWLRAEDLLQDPHGVVVVASALEPPPGRRDIPRAPPISLRRLRERDVLVHEIAEPSQVRLRRGWDDGRNVARLDERLDEAVEPGGLAVRVLAALGPDPGPERVHEGRLRGIGVPPLDPAGELVGERSRLDRLEEHRVRLRDELRVVLDDGGPPPVH
jgi:hypothetical protein